MEFIDTNNDDTTNFIDCLRQFGGFVHEGKTFCFSGESEAFLNNDSWLMEEIVFDILGVAYEFVFPLKEDEDFDVDEEPEEDRFDYENPISVTIQEN